MATPKNPNGPRNVAARLLREKGQKVCSKCGETKSWWQFQQGGARMRSQCCDCFNSIRRYR